MKVFFWDFQDDNDIARQWVLFVLNLLVQIFTFIALFRTWRYYRQCMFQMMPLSINLIATFVLLNLKLFEKGYQFALIGHFIEIFTYFLFCYTFAIMYTVISNPEKKHRVQKLWNIVLVVMIIMLLTLSILVFTGVISKKCQKDTQQWPAIISLIFQFGSFIPTVFYGINIVTKMSSKQNDSEEAQLSQFKSEIYLKQRRKQIKIVLATYSVSMIIRFVTSMVTIFLWDDLFQCTLIESSFIITSDVVAGQIVLVFTQVNQLLPHIVIPVAMYVVPLRGKSKAKAFKLHEQLIQQQEDDSDSYSHEENVKNRVSSLLASRISQDSSPMKRSIKTPDFLKQ